MLLYLAWLSRFRYVCIRPNLPVTIQIYGSLPHAHLGFASWSLHGPLFLTSPRLRVRWFKAISFLLWEVFPDTNFSPPSRSRLSLVLTGTLVGNTSRPSCQPHQQHQPEQPTICRTTTVVPPFVAVLSLLGASRPNKSTPRSRKRYGRQGRTDVDRNDRTSIQQY